MIEKSHDNCLLETAPCVSSDPLPTLRERMNAKAREKDKSRNLLGQCRCGKRTVKGVKTCPKCLLKSRIAARNAYRKRVGIPIDAPISDRGRKPSIPPQKRIQTKLRAKILKGVTRKVNKDGYGRESSWYVAAMGVKGRVLCRKWSISKYGEDGAKLAASLQKLLWVVESGLWKPEHGDPLAIIGYSESFGGNRDYDDCVIDNVSSPWIHEYENEERD